METRERNCWDEKGTYGREAHPPPELLMLAVDGELAPEEASQIESHLTACWVCRARTAKIESTIADFIEYRQAALDPRLTPPSNTWRNFWLRLDRRVEELGRPPLLFRFGTRLRELFFPRLSMARLTVVVSVASIALAVYWMSRSPVASANELLQRSIQAESARIQQVPEPVTYSRLQLRRKTTGAEESVMWESWRGGKNNLFRRRVADTQGSGFVRADEESAPTSAPAMIPPLMREFERVFRVNHLDAQSPLSAAAYLEWRKTIRVESETVTEVALPPQNQGLRLTTVVAGPPGADGIIEASLTVRSTDWHPVEERLKVQWRNEVREYELSETAYEVMPLAALTIFADHESAPAPSPITPPVAETMRVTMATPLFPPGISATESELRDAEVSALYALHRIHADLGEQIEILREPPSQGGQVFVRGLVESEERKEQLTEALRGLPLVRTRILTVEEAQRSMTQKSSATAAAGQAARLVIGVVAEQAVVGDRVAQPQAFRTALENYFAASTATSASGASTAQRVTELTNSSLARSEAALARAWALRRLAENPALSKVERLSPETRTRLAAMLQSHLIELRGEIRSLRGDLDPCLSFVAGGRAAGPESSAEVAHDWSDAALAIFRSVSRLDRRIHELFSSSGGTNTPAVAAQQALADFAETEKSLLILDNQTGRIAADNK